MLILLLGAKCEIHKQKIHIRVDFGNVDFGHIFEFSEFRGYNTKRKKMKLLKKPKSVDLAVSLFFMGWVLGYFRVKENAHKIEAILPTPTRLY